MFKASIFLLLIFTCTNLFPVTVIERTPDYGQMLGESIGEGLSKSLDRHFQQEREKKQVELQLLQESLIRERLAKLLDGYDPSKHREYVLNVLQSDLPDSTKKQTIDTLNECHNQHLKENKNWLAKLFG